MESKRPQIAEEQDHRKHIAISLVILKSQWSIPKLCGMDTKVDMKNGIEYGIQKSATKPHPLNFCVRRI